MPNQNFIPRNWIIEKFKRMSYQGYLYRDDPTTGYDYVTPVCKTKGECQKLMFAATERLQAEDQRKGSQA